MHNNLQETPETRLYNTKPFRRQTFCDVNDVKGALNPNFLNLTINREKFCL